MVLEDGSVEHSKDRDGRWMVEGEEAKYEYKWYATADEQGFVEQVHVTPANAPESKELEMMVEGLPEGGW